MLTRRRVLQALAALPFVGVALQARDQGDDPPRITATEIRETPTPELTLEKIARAREIMLEMESSQCSGEMALWVTEDQLAELRRDAPLNLKPGGLNFGAPVRLYVNGKLV